MSNILVIGESCLDVFIYGECKRLCPEAPVPVFNPGRRREIYEGMASNVVKNLESLNPQFSVDHFSPETSSKKTRYVDENSHYMIVRIDEDAVFDGNRSATIDGFIRFLEKIHPQKSLPEIVEHYDAVVVSDYNKGFLSVEFIEFVSDLFKRNTFLDTKKVLGPWSQKINYVKINNKEYEHNLRCLNGDLPEYFAGNLVVTLGKDGSKYFHNGSFIKVDPVILPVDSFSGAGDSFLAGLVYSILENESLKEAVGFANRVAAISVSKKGISTVTMEEIDKSYDNT